MYVAVCIQWDFDKEVLGLENEFQSDTDVNGWFPSILSGLLVWRVLTHFAKGFAKRVESAGKLLFPNWKAMLFVHLFQK